MKRALLLLTAALACSAFFITAESRGQFPVGRPGPGGPRMERPELAIEWWYPDEFAVPQNGAQMSQAILKEIPKVDRGESARFRVVVDGAERRPHFVALLPEEGGELLKSGQRVVGIVTITANHYSPRPGGPGRPGGPATPPSRDEFDSWKRNFQRNSVDFDDFTVVSRALVQLSGVGGGLINLLRQDVYAPFTGTVILVAQDRARDYEVFDVAGNRKDPRRYVKGDSIKELGTTLWILSEDKKYVAVFSQLGSTEATVGQRVESGKTRVGVCKDYKSRSFQLYRVYGPNQYFLNGSGPMKPTLLYPAEAEESASYPPFSQDRRDDRRAPPTRVPGRVW